MVEITDENRCDLCKGHGFIEISVFMGHRKAVDWVKCSGCNGLGTKP